MSEQELIHALQELVARHSPPAEPQRVSTELLFLDRWRIRILAGITILLWLGGIAGVLYMIVCFNRFIIAYSPAVPRDLIVSAEWYTTQEFRAKMDLHHSLEGCLAAVPALALAALGTIWLVFSSRQATLNQINLSLAELSEQVRQMRQAPRPPEWCGQIDCAASDSPQAGLEAIPIGRSRMQPAATCSSRGRSRSRKKWNASAFWGPAWDARMCPRNDDFPNSE